MKRRSQAEELSAESDKESGSKLDKRRSTLDTFVNLSPKINHYQQKGRMGSLLVTCKERSNTSESCIYVQHLSAIT